MSDEVSSEDPSSIISNSQSEYVCASKLVTARRKNAD